MSIWISSAFDDDNLASDLIFILLYYHFGNILQLIFDHFWQH